MSGISIEKALHPDEVALVWFPDRSMQIIAKRATGDIECMGFSRKQTGILKELLLRAEDVKK